MYRISRRFFLAALATFAVATTTPSWAADKLNVVTTFTILGDMARNVGGEHIVLTMVGPNGDAHVYEPTPADARVLAEADLVLVNPGFEGWINRLVKASGYNGPVVVAVAISALKAEEDRGHKHDAAKALAEEAKEQHHGELDPHAWQDLANGRLYVANISRALAAADPAHAVYRHRAEAYDGRLLALDREIRSRLDTIPLDRRKVITSHDAFRYFGRAYSIDFTRWLSKHGKRAVGRRGRGAGSPDAGQGNPGAVCGKHHRPTSRAATRPRSRRRHWRHALLGLGRPDRPGANLSRHVPPQRSEIARRSLTEQGGLALLKSLVIRKTPA